MPSDRTPADPEPAPGHEAQDAGSVVVGLDPASPAGVAVLHITVDPALVQQRLSEAAVGFQRLRDGLAQAAPAVREFGRTWERARNTAYEFGGVVPSAATGSADAMRWSPPADGEETPSCPA